MNEKLYRVAPPVGSITTPKEWMTEEDFRNFAKQITQGNDPWLEKVEKDPIDQVVEWFESVGYIVNTK